MASEQDEPLYLRQVGHKSYDAETHKRVTKRLSTFQINQTPKKGMEYVDEFALPRLTWATADSLYE
eukprot:1408444-Pyramimonas_sp.AAC.1